MNMRLCPDFVADIAFPNEVNSNDLVQAHCCVGVNEGKGVER